MFLCGPFERECSAPCYQWMIPAEHTFIVNLSIAIRIRRADHFFYFIICHRLTQVMHYLGERMNNRDNDAHRLPNTTTNAWNTLSTNCVDASSVNMFKNGIGKYRVRAG